MTTRNRAMILGGLTGLVSLVAMFRLVSGLFSDGLTYFAWAAILLAMVPWIGYSAWRARHGHLIGPAALAVLGLCVVGGASTWAFTAGPVVALVCSLAAFVVIWVHDWPPRHARGEDQFVHIEELSADVMDAR